MDPRKSSGKCYRGSSAVGMNFNPSLSNREKEALQSVKSSEMGDYEFPHLSPLHQEMQDRLTTRKASKRKYQRKKSSSDAKNGGSPKKRATSGSAFSKQGGNSGTSPLSSSSFDSAISDIYSTSIQTPRSDPTPEESGLICDINIPFETVLQENCFVNPIDVGGQDPGEILDNPGLLDNLPPSEGLPTYHKLDVVPIFHKNPPNLPKICEMSGRPPASQTPPALREQRRMYQQHLAAQNNLWREGLRRQEVEALCVDLLKRYQDALSAHPPVNPAPSLTGSLKCDPLLVATRLLSQSLSRLRLFLYSMDCMLWISMEERCRLYKSNICTVAILKASLGLEMGSMPVAYPLPYGEYLAETEALQLITAHDLYNELRNIIASVQSLGIRDFPVMLLVIMTVFFRDVPGLEVRMKKDQSGFPETDDRVFKIHQFYKKKLQMCLALQYGSTTSASMLENIYVVVDRIKAYTDRLRKFLGDVTRVGLQRQFEPVCENLGLIAYLIQSEPCQA